jgi:hypothetical protein
MLQAYAALGIGWNLCAAHRTLRRAGAFPAPDSWSSLGISTAICRPEADRPSGLSEDTPTGWCPAQQPNPYFWWADARRAKGAVNELGAHVIALPRVAARRLAEHRRSRTATHRTDSGNERPQLERSRPAGTARLRRSQRSSASAADSPPPRNSRFLTATSPGPTGADRSASLRSRQSDPVVRRRHPRGPPLRPDFGDGHAVQCVVEAALRTERTSMGLAPGAELSVLRRRS